MRGFLNSSKNVTVFGILTNMEYSQVFDIVKFEKEKTVATFNLFHKIAKLRQIIFEAVVVLGLVSWSTARVPAVARTATVYVVQLSTYLFNHHVVFLIGNSIIVLLFVLFRRNGAVHQAGASGGDLYDEYVKHGEAGLRGEPALPSPRETACRPPSEEVGGRRRRAEEKQIVVSAEETVVIAQCDDVASAIEKAARQIERFQRTQSEKLRREIGARPQVDLRRSESHNLRKSGSSGNQFAAASDMERLSSEEFRRTVDAFIDEHWSKKKKAKQNGFEGYDQKYHLLKRAEFL